MSVDRGSPESLIDEADAHPEWGEARIAAQVDALIAHFDQDLLAPVLLSRFDDLHRPSGEIVLRLAEAIARPDLLEALADALITQETLAPERLWDALNLLEGTGLIEERPILAEWRDELEEMLVSDTSIASLLSQIEDDPESLNAALEGLSRIEPQIRDEILAELATQPMQPGLAKALRQFQEQGITESITRTSVPRVADVEPSRMRGGVVSVLDADGACEIGLIAESDAGWIVARFSCHVLEGVTAIDRETLADESVARERFANLSEGLGEGAEEISPALVRVLLITSINLGIVALPAFGLRSPPSEIAADVRAVLAACPEWRDTSELLHDLAVEIAIRDGDAPPNPSRDAGPFRVLFEKRILPRVELYRQMLMWSATVWQETGREELSASAFRIAEALADPHNAVPGHPFLSAFMVKSLMHAQETYRAGVR